MVEAGGWKVEEGMGAGQRMTGMKFYCIRADTQILFYFYDDCFESIYQGVAFQFKKYLEKFVFNLSKFSLSNGFKLELSISSHSL